MVQCAVSLIAVDVDGEEDESKDCREEWKGAEEVIIISFVEFHKTAVDVLKDCHHCALRVVRICEFEFREEEDARISENPKIGMSHFSRLAQEFGA